MDIVVFVGAFVASLGSLVSPGTTRVVRDYVVTRVTETRSKGYGDPSRNRGGGGAPPMVNDDSRSVLGDNDEKT